MNRKLKVMILIGSALVIGFSLWSMAHIGVTAHAAEYQPGLIGAVQVATPGDAEYLHKVRSLTDCPRWHTHLQSDHCARESALRHLP